MFSQSLKRKLSRFVGNTSGNFAMMFALATPALFGAMALAVDVTKIYRDQAEIQNALDSAALAAGKQLAVITDVDQLEVYAEQFFLANIGPKINKSKLQFGLQISAADDGGNRVKVRADYDIPTHIARIWNSDEVAMAVFSEVAAGNKTIEVALVMDNSGSMDSLTGSTSKTRLEKAQEAALELTERLYQLANISNKPDPVRISIVPFGSSVNVGPGRKNANWLDKRGWSSIHHENITWNAFDDGKRGDVWPNMGNPAIGYKGNSNGSLAATSIETRKWLTRWTLFDALGTEWAGCVEMRPWPHHTTDAEPTLDDPDTLFVPTFAPDEPDVFNGYYSEDDDYKNNYLHDYRRAYATGYTSSYSGAHYLNTTIGGLKNYDTHERQQMRQDWAMKYHPAAKFTSSGGSLNKDEYGASAGSNFGTYGPNYSCTTDELVPLTQNENKIKTAINDMDAGGYTNIQAGILWGWRTLSPGKPFIQGRTYETIQNDKYIIVLTDGENTLAGQSTDNESRYNAWGYSKADRIMEGVDSSLSKTEAMDAHTARTCENIKAIMDGDNEAAYKIFTIAYDVPENSSVKTLLYNCASRSREGGKYYYDVSGDALSAAMRAIGDEISDLRIAK